MKGNDGKAKRQRNKNNILYAVGSLSAILLVVTLVKGRGSKGNHNRRLNDSVDRWARKNGGAGGKITQDERNKLLREAKRKREERGDTTEKFHEKHHEGHGERAPHHPRHHQRSHPPPGHHHGHPPPHHHGGPPPGYPGYPSSEDSGDEEDEEGYGHFRPPPPPGYGQHGGYGRPPPPLPGYAGGDVGEYVPPGGGHRPPPPPGYGNFPPPPGYGGHHEGYDEEGGGYRPPPPPGYGNFPPRPDGEEYPPPPGYYGGYGGPPGGGGRYADGGYGSPSGDAEEGGYGVGGPGWGEYPNGHGGSSGSGRGGDDGDGEEGTGEENAYDSIYGAGQHGYENNMKDYRGGAGLAKTDRNLHDTTKEQEVEGISEEELNAILSSEVHLVELFVPPKGNIMSPFDENSYNENIMGEFCTLEWSLHKKNPSSVPMFRDLVSKSPDCKHNRIKVSLKQIADAAREYDQNNRDLISSSGDDHNPEMRNEIPGAAYNLDPTGFVFHESRCGSTLVANSLAAMNPEAHRVYSESQPPIEALTACGDDFSRCPISTASDLFSDTIYMMSRSNDARETNVFWKIQSAGSRFISVFVDAFPDTPWLFVYREPNQVMMSQLDVPNIHNALCVRGRKRPIPSIKEFLKRRGLKVKSLSDEDFCAVHLATICEGATKELESSSTGKSVNYSNLISSLIDDIIPSHFGIPVGSVERGLIEEVSGHYSKARGTKNQNWKGDDSEQKERRATEEMKSASEKFLQETYDLLEMYT